MMLWRAIVILALIAGGPAIADRKLDPAKRDAAAKLVAEGSARFDARDFQTALDKYEAAFALYPAPKLHYNLGLALAALGRNVEAANAYERFLAEATDAPASARADATKLLARLERALGRIVVDTKIAEAVVSIDGLEVGATPVNARANPGPHVIRVVAPNYKPWEQSVTVAANATVRMRAELAPLDLRPTVVTAPDEPQPAPLPQQPVPAEHHDERGSILGRWWFWGAVGAVVIGGAAITYVATRSSGPDSELGTITPFRVSLP